MDADWLGSTDEVPALTTAILSNQTHPGMKMSSAIRSAKPDPAGV
jgi:hypothetical protein